jgi:1-acyl-sn-glycerol-3-phosphate acyltransferase
VTEERIVPAREPSESAVLPDVPATSALGRDPFEEETGIDPILECLDALEGEPTRGTAKRASAGRSAAERIEATAVGRAGRAAARARRRAARRSPRRRSLAIPALREIELPKPRGWLDWFAPDDERRALCALAHLVQGENSHDRFGFSPDVTQIAFPLFRLLHRAYFRVKSEGHDQIPATGPAILASNHAGLLPFDAAMTVVDVALHTDPPRLPRAIVDRWAGTLPWINIFYARVGQVIGTRENCSDLLDEGQLLLVFPEGIEGARKAIAQRYRLQHFRVGFVEHALRSRAPIIPMAIVGSDDQTPILYDVQPLARRLGLPALPITPTFPWLGPLGLLPYPVRYRILYGKPLNFHERFGPEGADDARLVRYLANQLRRSVQQLLDRGRQ